MRFTDILVVMVLMVFADISVCCGFNTYFKITETVEKKREELNSTHFISESFRNCCQGKGFDNLIQWQKNCKALWNLEYISWSKAEMFMEDNHKEKGELLYGAWNGDEGQGEVYWRVIAY